MGKQTEMENTIIHTKVLIRDFHRRINHSESSGSDVHVPSVTEDDSDDLLVDEEETSLMRSLGLPTRFTSTKRYYKSKESSYVFNGMYWNNIENINRKFLDYWQENGDNLVLTSWISEYKDHINPEFINGCESHNNEHVNAAAENNETDESWNEKWNEHYWRQYESEYQIFVNSLLDSSLSSEIKNIALNDITEAGEADHSDTSSASHKTISITFKNDRHESNVAKGCEMRNNGIGGDEGDEPPDERPIKIKRECESDANFSEDERKLRKIEWRRNPTMSSLEPISPVKQSTEKAEGEWKTQKRKKRKENKDNRPKNAWDWQKRYRLFSRFDEGIKLDDESWYSVTPEKIAEHIANRVMREDVHLIVDGFCGAGGNTIQFALASPNVRVIAADIDANKIALAKHNAAIYGVDQRIDFIVADFLNIPKLLNVKVDAVFVSPPWGGPDYKKSEKYRLEMMTPDVDNILTACRALTPNIAFYLPRNIDEADLLPVAKCSFEIEQNILNNKLLTVTAYFGNLIKSEST